MQNFAVVPRIGEKVVTASIGHLTPDREAQGRLLGTEYGRVQPSNPRPTLVLQKL